MDLFLLVAYKCVFQLKRWKCQQRTQQEEQGDGCHAMLVPLSAMAAPRIFASVDSDGEDVVYLLAVDDRRQDDDVCMYTYV